MKDVVTPTAPAESLAGDSMDAERERSRMLQGRLAASTFVVIWCTGYPAGKIAIQHGGPFTTLLLRFALASASAIIGTLALIARAEWPGVRALRHRAVVGALSLALVFGGIYEGLCLGVSTGVSALIVGAMPLATALIGLTFGARLSARQWAGLAIGFSGVILVLQRRLGSGHADGIGHLASAVGLLGLSLGTLYQKRYRSQLDLRIGLGAQHAAAALVMLPFAAFVEHFRTDGSATYAGVLGWIVLVNAISGFALFFSLLRRDAATEVTQLFFLMPPMTALIGFLRLRERLSLPMLPGFALNAPGVWLGTRKAQE